MDFTETYVGVDASSTTLAVGVVLSGEVWEISNDVEGVTGLRDQVCEMEPTLIVLEVTGGLERLLFSVSVMRLVCVCR